MDTNMTFVVITHLTEDEKKEVLRLIRKMTGAPGSGDYKGRYNIAVRQIWQDKYSTRLPFADFQHEIHQWGTSKNKKSNKLANVTANDKAFVFASLYRFLIKETGFVPNDDFMNKLGKFWNLSRSIGGSTRDSLEKREGYKFTPATIDGFTGTKIDPEEAKMDAIQRQIYGLQTILDDMRSKRKS
jgi:hypothetical protein